MPYRQIQQKAMFKSITKDFKLARVAEIVLAIFITLMIIGFVVSEDYTKECEYYKDKTAFPARCIKYFSQ
jgi:hypothetical protein